MRYSLLAAFVFVTMVNPACGKKENKPPEPPPAWEVEATPICDPSDFGGHFVSDDGAHYAYILLGDPQPDSPSQPPAPSAGRGMFGSGPQPVIVTDVRARPESRKVVVVVDGKSGPEFLAGNIAGDIVFSPAGRFWYEVRVDREVLLVIDHLVAERSSVPVAWKVQFSPDGRHVAYHVRREGGQTFVVDGKDGPLSESVEVSSFTFCRTGSGHAYVAADKGKKHIVRDGGRLEGFDAVADPRLSDDGGHLIYAGQRGEEWVIMLDDREVGKCDGQFVPPAVRISSSGAHWAYAVPDAVVLDGVHKALRNADLRVGGFFGEELACVAYVDDKRVVAIDGRPGQFAVAPGTYGEPVLAFSGDGRHMAYLARDKDGFRFVVDGVAGRPFEAARADGYAGLVLSPEGKHAAGIFSTADDRRIVVLDGRASGPYENASQLTFSPDGRHLAYVVSKAGRESIIRDGEDSGAYEHVEWESLVFSPDGKHLAAAVAGEGRNRLAECKVVIDDYQGPPVSARGTRLRPRFAPDGSLHYMALLRDKVCRIRCVANKK